uniref:Reverse transcriptase domain-containing protein n=1 Tax=Heliothis virescens TaxID=7102 RepID=A0A2A4JEX3_HELVI
MNAEQFAAFLAAQQQQQAVLTALLQELVQLKQHQGSPSTDNSNNNNYGNETPTTAKQNIVKHFKCDKFNPEITAAENFIELFEAKCRIWGEETINIQKDLLINSLTPDIYHELKVALTPNFEKTSYNEVKMKLLDLYRTKKTRYKALIEFWNSTREPNETMERYANRLKELSRDCGYEGEMLERQLRDRFATGLNHTQLEVDLKQRWPELREGTGGGKTREITFTEIFAVAQSREIAENDDSTLNNNLKVNRIRQNKRQGKRTSDTTNNETVRKLRPDQCRRCGKRNKHDFDDCTAKDHPCRACGNTGHYESVCIKSGRAYLTSEPKRYQRKYKSNKRNKTQKINNRTDTSETSSTTSHADYLTEESESEDNPVHTVNKMYKKTTRCKKIDVIINGIKCTMDWDPGSIYSIISTKMWKAIGAPALMKGPKLQAYCNFKLKPKGITDVTVEVDNVQKILPVVVMDKAQPMLFGLQWSEMYDMTFPKPVYSIKPTTETSLDLVLANHTDLFDNKLGKVKDYQVKIHIKPGSEAKHLPARPIKFSMRKNIEIELERLLREGVITEVDPNITPIEWATPTVNVLKPTGQVRICGDYRITINPVLIKHTHPVPLFDQLRQQLAYGDKYSKIDLKDAYLQFEIAPESKKYLTISTHKGYFVYNRMPFGIATAPSIFQHFLDKLLNDIPNVAVFFDDIAVTGTNDKEHIQTLSKVFNRLKQAGLKHNKLDDMSLSEERIRDETRQDVTLKQLSCLLDNVRPNIRRTLRHKHIKANIDAEHKTPHFRNGEAVYIRTKLENKWKPAVIEERKHRYSYVVRTPEGVVKRRHADHIRPRESVAQSPIVERETETESFFTPAGSATPPLSQPVVENTSSSPLTLEQTPVLRRSKRTVRPPQRLIEIMS